VASDVSMRWLMLARKRLDDLGCDGVHLVCCSAEEPPFRAGWFDVVGTSDVIEHAARQAAFVAGCAHVLRRGGVLFIATPNRFSLGLEPHVRLWGVGWLPRRWAPRYVSRLRHAPYDHVRLLSARELRRMLAESGLESRIETPEIPVATQEIYSGFELRLVRLYNRVRLIGAVRRSLLTIGPFFHVFARKAVK
jgi:2-polyprenyl-3-methyl-5-hydroxy-6-metoxy-1,4-benzoquinol methylase